VDAVPGKVVNSFIPSRTVQEVNDDTVRLYSVFLHNRLCKTVALPLPIANVEPDLFALISSEDCEDIVGLYLQEQGYRLIPSSCRSDTAAYEYVLRHAETGQAAIAQVKCGFVDLEIDAYSGLSETVFLFTSHGAYVGQPRANVHCISLAELRSFVDVKRLILPQRVKNWMELIAQLTSACLPAPAATIEQP
jgi:hypothetical protein